MPLSSVASVKSFAKTIIDPPIFGQSQAFTEEGPAAKAKAPPDRQCFRGRGLMYSGAKAATGATTAVPAATMPTTAAASMPPTPLEQARQLAASAGKSKARARTTALPQAKPKQAKAPAVSGMAMAWAPVCCGRGIERRLAQDARDARSAASKHEPISYILARGSILYSAVSTECVQCRGG
ncbi:LOW QUALITY PROTEIN: hypothetical protein MKX08_007448 [Trichoderma sp. CBMAI-0020]|nr:LOW QUALITY PROTEIN: hypothetical protein MKX08_007448 [Trichoderma sp. CBMAI-0020]